MLRKTKGQKKTTKTEKELVGKTRKKIQTKMFNRVFKTRMILKMQIILNKLSQKLIK